jgi:hypothetical protein
MSSYFVGLRLSHSIQIACFIGGASMSSVRNHQSTILSWLGLLAATSFILVIAILV